MIETIPQVVNINTKEFFRKTMVFSSYEEFAVLIAETIAQADEPDILADIVKRHLTNASLSNMQCCGYRRYGGAFTLGPVRWERCKNTPTMFITYVNEGGRQITDPACEECYKECIENKVNIQFVVPIKEGENDSN